MVGNSLFYRLAAFCAASGTWHGSLARLGYVNGARVQAADLVALARAGLIRLAVQNERWHVWICAKEGARG